MKFFRTLYILPVIFPLIASGQFKKTLYYSSRNGTFCSQTIILDSTGLFFRELGCEGRSTISFGRYAIGSGNTISFHYLPFDSIPPVAKIIQSKAVNKTDSLITITFYDRYKNPLDLNFGIQLADTLGLVHEKWTDDKGHVEVSRFIFKYVSLTQFLTIFGGANGIPIGQTSLQIYLNLPELFLQYPELQVEQRKPEVLQMKPNGLYDLKSKKLIYKLN